MKHQNKILKLSEIKLFTSTPDTAKKVMKYQNKILKLSQIKQLPCSTPDTAKKVPPKVKPKTARAKFKEAKDNSMVVPEAPSPVVIHGQSQPYPSLSKRAKSESHIKRIPQASPKHKKPSTIIESSNDGQQVLVLSPAGSKNANKDMSVRIFLPPPPPIFPPSQEQESENKRINGKDSKIPVDTTPVSTNNNSESTVTSKLHINVVTSGSYCSATV